MNALWKRLAELVPMYAKSPTRLSLLGMVACIAALIVLEKEIFSIHVLAIAGAIVFAIGCLIYSPSRLLLWYVIAAVGILIWYEAKDAKDWQILAGFVGIGFWWITWCMDKTGNLILRRLDTLEGKLGDIESKRDGLR